MCNKEKSMHGKKSKAQTGVAQLDECCPAGQRVSGLIPSGHTPGCGLVSIGAPGCSSVPAEVCVGGNWSVFLPDINVFLPIFPLPSLLKIK